MRSPYVVGVALLAILTGCSTSDTPNDTDQRDAYTTVYGSFAQDGLDLLLDVCAGDETSDDIFVFMAAEDDDDRSIRALRALCPEYVEDTIDG